MKMYACRIIYFSKISWIREINFQSFFFAFQCQILLKIFFKRECNKNCIKNFTLYREDIFLKSQNNIEICENIPRYIQKL